MLKWESFSVTLHNVPAVAQLCYELDGMPPAIQLAAARINVLPVEEIIERLDEYGSGNYAACVIDQIALGEKAGKSDHDCDL